MVSPAVVVAAVVCTVVVVCSAAVEVGVPSGGFSVIVVVGAPVDVTGTVVSMVSPAVVVAAVVCTVVVVVGAVSGSPIILTPGWWSYFNGGSKIMKPMALN